MRAATNKTHGFSGKNYATRHPIYNCWAAMIQRCTNPIHPSWKDYGGRGIAVCDAWLEFENFRRDMFSTWRRGLRIERKDNNAGYCPENCCWATQREQVLNRRNAVMVSYNGETKNLSQWVKQFGISQGTLTYRLFVLKWDSVRAFNTPPTRCPERNECGQFA